jgi:hypothetical protein
MLLALVSCKIVAAPVRLVATLFVVALFLAGEVWRAQRPVVRVMVHLQMIWELESKAATMLAPVLESFIGVPLFVSSGSCQLPKSHHRSSREYILEAIRVEGDMWTKIAGKRRRFVGVRIRLRFGAELRLFSATLLYRRTGIGIRKHRPWVPRIRVEPARVDVFRQGCWCRVGGTKSCI